MTPDFEKINERMEQASLNDFAPNFNKEAEWLQLSQKLHPIKRRSLIPIWSYAAAILLLLAGGTWFAWHLSYTNDQPVAAQQPTKNITPTPGNKTVPAADTTTTPKTTLAQTDNPENGIKPSDNKNSLIIKKRPPIHKASIFANNRSTKSFICNSTPCPLQICISQTMKCPDIQPAAISSCSTLEPDQSALLSYKAHDKIAKNCSLTVNEIEITSIATGETILLNASSSPSTAQDVFNYITGKKKGDILAGMFNSDCNHQTQKHGLRLDNSYGNLIIQ